MSQPSNSQWQHTCPSSPGAPLVLHSGQPECSQCGARNPAPLVAGVSRTAIGPEGQTLQHAYAEGRRDEQMAGRGADSPLPPAPLSRDVLEAAAAALEDDDVYWVAEVAHRGVVLVSLRHDEQPLRAKVGDMVVLSATGVALGLTTPQVPLDPRIARALGERAWDLYARAEPIAGASPAPLPVGYVDPQRLSELRRGDTLSITLVAESEADLREGGDVPVYAAGVPEPRPLTAQEPPAVKDGWLVPVAWRYKERVNDEFDTDWILTKNEPADGVRVIAKEPLFVRSHIAGVEACHTDHPLRHYDRTCPACESQQEKKHD